ncbi:MAG: biopolymer transporter ExbD [Thermogutta sp.]|nr:MAG: biopolymer transporter ExbD [Thermogutta sp.]
MLRVKCPQCGTVVTVADNLRGTSGPCPACGHVIPFDGPSKPSVEAVEEAQSVPIRFTRPEMPEEVMDMTPMVDVVFQLLIFFMMTAAFSLQKALEMPPSDKQEKTAQAQTLEELENESDFVIVRIDRDNNITVDGEDAPSDQELLNKLREAKLGELGKGAPGRTGLLVLADPQCRHETVVKALDAGNAVGMERIRLATVEDTAF